MSGRFRPPAVVLLCVLALTACGDSEDPGTAGSGSTNTAAARTVPEVSRDAPLSAGEIAVIRRAQEAVGAYCAKVARGLAEGDAPTQRDFDRVTRPLDELAELASHRPGAEAPDGATPRLALGDIAENLEGTNCDPRLVARIDEALATLPAE
jgi:hypothetical protein